MHDKGDQARFFRDVAAVMIDLDDVEAIDFKAPGGTGRIAVTYDLSGDAWCLAVSDNGIGRQAQATTPSLGTGIISALVSQLDSCLEVATCPNGTTASISHPGIRTNAHGHTSRLRRARQG